MKKVLLLFLFCSFFVAQAQVTTLFEDDFESYTATDNVGEDTDIPDTYMSYDVDGDGYNWGLANVANFTQTTIADMYSGNFMISASYITTGAGGNGGVGAISPNNILVFPMMSIPAGAENVVFSCTLGSGTDPDYFSEHYAVTVTTENTQDAILAATPVLEATLPAVGTETVTFSLDDFAGQDVYVAFRHFNTTDQWILGIDDVSVTYGATGSLEDLQALGFTYYPNPVNDVLNLKADVSINEISISNLLGQEVYRSTPNMLQQTVDFSNLETGVYMVSVSIDGNEGTFKIVKR